MNASHSRPIAWLLAVSIGLAWPTAATVAWAQAVRTNRAAPAAKGPAPAVKAPAGSAPGTQAAPGTKTAPGKKAAPVAPTATAQPPVEDYRCFFTEGPLKIDGLADEAAWKAAQPVGKFAMPWVRSGSDTPLTATRAKLLWDREYLYFFADMDDTDLYADVTAHDGITWNNDVFELFFKPADDKPGYYEFQVNAANTTLDMLLPRRGAGGYERFKADGEFDFQSAVHLNGTLNRWSDKDTGWSVEGRLAWKDFARTGGRPNVDERWKFALCRYDYSVDFEGPALSTGAPLKTGATPNFHYFEDYAPIRFVGPAESPSLQAAKPFGIEKLAPLTTSRVLGSPDPPLPYTVERIFDKLTIQLPVTITRQPRSDRVWIVTQPWSYAPSALRRFENTPGVEEFETLIPAEGDRVMYDIVFHPQFAKNGFVYIGSNGSFGGAKRSRVTRYHVDPQPPYAFDADSATTIIEWESDGHNGAAIAFATDGTLFVTSGDGSSDSDTNVKGQDLSELTSKVLHIDVDHVEPGQTYSVPKDNPFLGQKNVRPETWAYGLRNPWRAAVDPATGQLWVGNNGQDLWEQIYLVERGANYGWSVIEGTHEFNDGRQPGPTPISKPAADHPHSEARSLTGGLVSHSDKFPQLAGAYLYGDYSTGKVWAIRHDGKAAQWHQEIADTPLAITAFAHGNEGDIWLLDHMGAAIYRLVPTPDDAPKFAFPRRLSESGLFQNVATHTMADGVIPYSVNSPLWSDAAYKERFLAIPQQTGTEPPIGYTHSAGWNFPNDTVLVKSFALETNDSASRRWIETRFLVRRQNEWFGYSYEWNADGTDAELVTAAGQDRDFDVRDSAAPGGVRRQTWHYPSRAECMVCHSRAANFVLGLQTGQMNRDHHYPGGVDNQLRTFEHLGLLRVNWTGENNVAERNAFLETARRDAGDKAFEPETERQINQRLDEHIARRTAARDQREAPKASPLLPRPPERLPRLADAYDPQQPLAARARAYLHSNCAHCHVPSGGGNSKLDLHADTPLAKMNLVGEKPLHHGFGLEDAKLLAPGAPDRSALVHRLKLRGGGQMPPLATSLVDRDAVELLRAWIVELSPPSGGAGK